MWRSAYVSVSATRLAPDHCSRRSLWRASRQSEPRGLGHAHGQPPVADGVAIAVSCVDAFADAVTVANSGDAEPDGRASDAIADTRHDDRSRVLPAAHPFSGGEVVNEPALVPVLRTVPKSTATATAAVKALLAGPSAKERSATAKIVTVIPDGTKLRGIEISGGLATVDLSAEFASTSPADAWDFGMFELRGRLAQVTYTLTQFASIDRVSFKLDGKPLKALFGMPDPENGSFEKIALDKPVTRATYRDHYLPLIFVDRPAWGAALLNPGRVTGLANVFEAQFQDRPARQQRQGAGRCSGCGKLRYGLLGNIRRDPVLPRVEGPMGDAAGLGHLGVLRQAGRRARVSGLLVGHVRAPDLPARRTRSFRAPGVPSRPSRGWLVCPSIGGHPG